MANSTQPLVICSANLGAQGRGLAEVPTHPSAHRLVLLPVSTRLAGEGGMTRPRESPSVTLPTNNDKDNTDTKSTLSDGDSCDPHFTDKETGAQRN